MLKFRNDLNVGRTEQTVETIMATLLSVRNKVPFDSLAFLDDTTAVMARIEEMSGTDSTRKTHLGRIMAVLKEGTTYDFYKEEHLKVKKRLAAHLETHEKSAAEEVKLVSWDRVMEVRNKLVEECKAIGETMTSKQYETLQTLMLVMLYTEVPPRRNDYALMDVVRTMGDMGDTTSNYYCIDRRKFVFNNYKTKEEYGQQVFDVPDAVADVIDSVVGMRLLVPTLRRVPLLVNQNGNRINAVSAITRMMTKAFGTPMGATAMRHIYLAHEFPTLLDDIEKRKRVAEAMAHSVKQQLQYIKR
jgi:hypothetical protein